MKARDIGRHEQYAAQRSAFSQLMQQAIDQGACPALINDLVRTAFAYEFHSTRFPVSTQQVKRFSLYHATDIKKSALALA